MVRKVLLFPFSGLLYLILWLRHGFYRIGISKAYLPSIKSISVGNLSIGGAGKSPFVAYLVHLLSTEQSKVFVLSRGYGRKTKGPIKVTLNHNSTEVGDEPLQLKRMFPELEVWVNENRVQTIKALERKFNVCVLDDAFQHRKLKAAFNIVLLPYQFFMEDKMYLFPVGKHRDLMSRLHAATCIVITKCPNVFDDTWLLNKLKKYNKPIYFTHIEYGSISVKPQSKVILLTGIASPDLFKTKVASDFELIKHYAFKDHHHFSSLELDMVIAMAKANNCPTVITSEKDFQRLDVSVFLEEGINLVPWKIRTVFHKEEKHFTQLINQYVRSN